VLLIRAVSFKGKPVGREVSAQFGEGGGTIGRGENCTLVLTDPERYISRTHASISFQAGGFVITNSAAKNPVLLNGQTLGSGSQARLADGDQIMIGDYALEVAQTARHAPAVPAGAGAFQGVDPFADLLKPSQAARSGQPGGPDLGDPWADPAAVRSSGAELPGSGDPLGELRGKEPSIDELFNLPGAPGQDIGGLDRPLEDLLQPGPRGTADPFDLLGGPGKPIPPPTIPDQGPEIFTPFAPPAARPDPALEPWVETPRVPPPESRLPRAEPRMPQPSASPVPPAPAERAEPTPRQGSPVGTSEEVLLRAFLQGVGISDARIRRLTPESMEAIGKLLREAVHGTLDLLRARGLVKSEMRADVTRILSVDNNPLKFSPTVEAALAQLLAAPLPGFMPPMRAMKDAYDDLRAHQFGFMAGMRAALEEVLGRFTPQELEKRLTNPSMLDSLLATNRKAKLWDLFVERYRDVASEAREDFNTAFGKAFLRAYEAQVKNLRAEGRRG
jgi:type VI secretion system FHA domain protein